MNKPYSYCGNEMSWSFFIEFSITHRILVREGERTDFLLIFLEGSVQKMKRSKLCPPDCDPSLKSIHHHYQSASCHYLSTTQLHS